MYKKSNRRRISDSELMKLINPQLTIMENLIFIKSKGYKISKDRICKFLKIINDNRLRAINNIDSDIEDALEIVKQNAIKNTIPTKEFNRTLNKMFHELKDTPIYNFEDKKQQIVNWVIDNYSKVEQKARTLDEFMCAMRIYINNMKKQASVRIQEEHIAKIKKDPLFRLEQLRGTMDEIIEEMKNKRIEELINEII